MVTVKSFETPFVIKPISANVLCVGRSKMHFVNCDLIQADFLNLIRLSNFFKCGWIRVDHHGSLIAGVTLFWRFVLFLN